MESEKPKTPLYTRYLTPNRQLEQACLIDDRESIMIAIARGAHDSRLALKSACKGGHRSLVDSFVNRDRRLWRSLVNGDIPYDNGLEGACEGGHRDIVDWMLRLGATGWGIGLHGACKGGSREMVDIMIAQGANNWQSGLCGACEGGHRHLVDLMINNLELEDKLIKIRGLRRIGNNLNDGLYGACQGGNLEMIDLMIKSGATNWESGLIGACHGGHIEIVQKMLQLGAHDDHYSAIYAAISFGDIEIVDLLLSSKHYSMEGILHNAVVNLDKYMTYYLLSKGAYPSFYWTRPAENIFFVNCVQQIPNAKTRAAQFERLLRWNNDQDERLTVLCNHRYLNCPPGLKKKYNRLFHVMQAFCCKDIGVFSVAFMAVKVRLSRKIHLEDAL